MTSGRLFFATAAGKAVLLPDVLVQYRQHGEQVAGAYRARAPKTIGTRVAQSAALNQSTVVDRLEAHATRAFFRASGPHPARGAPRQRGWART